MFIKRKAIHNRKKIIKSTMAINNDKPHDIETSDDEDPWEMVSDDDDDDAAPLIAAGAAAAAALDAAGDDAGDDAGKRTGDEADKRTGETMLQQESNHHIGTVDLSGVANSNAESAKQTTAADANASFLSCLSSVTGDHHAINDVEEDGEDDDTKEEEEIVFEEMDDLSEGEYKVEQEASASAPPDDEWGWGVAPGVEEESSAAPPLENPEEKEEVVQEVDEDRANNEGGGDDAPDAKQEASAASPSEDPEENEADEEEEKDEDSSDPLVDTLSEMGFEKEQIEKAIGDLKESGETEIDADSVISSMKNEADGEEKKDGDSSDPLVDTLSQMGFEKEQIEKAIGDLKKSGESEIDADSVIGSMMDEENNAGSDAEAGAAGPRIRPLGRTWNFVESTVQDLDNQHQLRRRTQTAVHSINRSAREIWSNVQTESERLGSNVRDESQRFRSNLKETCDQADVRARDATTQVKYAASNAKDSMIRANQEYGITEKVATAAVIGGATLLVLGNPRAGVGAMALAGASLAAGEAMKNSSPRTGGSSRYAKEARDFGLREGVHLD